MAAERPRLAELVSVETEEDGTKTRDDDDDQEDKDELFFTDSDDDENSKERRKVEQPWRLDEQAEEEYELAATLFYQRYQAFLESRGMCYMALDKFDRQEIGESGSRLFRALVRSYTNDRRNERRRFMRGLERESFLPEEDGKKRKVDNKPTEGKKVIMRTQVTKKVRQLTSKLKYIKRGNKKATIFTSGDLADVIRLTSTKSNKQGIAKVMELFLELAPKIEYAWHANVFMRFKQPQSRPFITPEMLEAARRWLATSTEWKQRRKSTKDKALKRLERSH